MQAGFLHNNKYCDDFAGPALPLGTCKQPRLTRPSLGRRGPTPGPTRGASGDPTVEAGKARPGPVSSGQAGPVGFNGRQGKSVDSRKPPSERFFSNQSEPPRM